MRCCGLSAGDIRGCGEVVTTAGVGSHSHTGFTQQLAVYTEALGSYIGGDGEVLYI